MERTVFQVMLRRFAKVLAANYKPAALFAGVYFLSLIFIFLSHIAPDSSLYSVGQSSKETLRSEYSFIYDDKFEIENMEKTIESNQPLYYSYQDNHRASFNSKLSDFILVINKTSDSDFIKTLKYGKYNFSAQTIEWLFSSRGMLSLYTNRLLYIYEALTSKYYLINKSGDDGAASGVDIITKLGNKKTAAEKLLLCPVEKDFLITFIGGIYTGMSKDFKSIMAEVLINLVEPTALLNPEAREQIIKKELYRERKQKLINKSDFIIKKGDIITEEQLAKIIAYSEYKKNDFTMKFWAHNLLYFFLVFFLAYRFTRYEKETFKKRYNVYLTLISFVAVNFIYYAAYLYTDIPSVPPFLLMPFAIISISLPLLLRNDRVAIILLISFSLFSIFYPIFDIITFSNLIIISLSTIYTSQLLKNRNDFFIAGIFIGLIELLFSFIYSLYYGNFDIREWGIILIFAFGNGFISSIFSLGLMPLLENIFNIPTRFRLLELTNPTLSPLLNKLRTEAPGTYNHSLLLGDMCEAAAEKLNIDSLLAKGIAYYHDIGKAEISEYFIENQDGKNKHDELKTSISVSVIKSHTKLGVELARKYRLPEEIISGIREHHGTTAISYFYHQALGLLGDENVNISDYEYPGPKPQSKETAILMLADGIETTVRAYAQNNERFTTKIIEDIIEDVIQKRIAQGQFDECNITLRELKITADEFFKLLAGYHHKRIEYKK